MSTPTGPLEVRPLLPPERSASRSRLSTCRFEVDDATGGVRWYGDSLRGREADPVRLQLPGRGSPALARVVRATYAPTDQLSLLAARVTACTRLWLVDASGAVVARSGWLPGLADLWTDDVLAPLTARGVEIGNQRFTSVYDAHRAYRGAVPMWWLRSRRTVPAVLVLLFAAIVAVVVVLNLLLS